MSVGISTALDAATLLKALDRYPFGCSEQITSRAMPLLYVNELASEQHLALDTAIDQRPEIAQAKKNTETGELNKQFARNQLLPTLSFQGTMGVSGLGKDYGDSFSKNFF